MFREVVTTSKTTSWAVLAGSCACLAIACPHAAAASGAEQLLAVAANTSQSASSSDLRSNCEPLPAQAPQHDRFVFEPEKHARPAARGSDTVSEAQLGPSAFGSPDLLALSSIAALWAAARCLQRLRKPRRRTRPARWVASESHPPARPRVRRIVPAR